MGGDAWDLACELCGGAPTHRLQVVRATSMQLDDGAVHLQWDRLVDTGELWDEGDEPDGVGPHWKPPLAEDLVPIPADLDGDAIGEIVARCGRILPRGAYLVCQATMRVSLVTPR